jgi:hypothetical protein
MRVYGADFSGAKSPQITYTVGEFEEDGTFEIIKLMPCDDRSDLLGGIMTWGGIWGLDFPFSLPMSYIPQNDWWALSQSVITASRQEFYNWLDTLGRFEGKCGAESVLCRKTDQAMNAYSPLKRVNPGLHAMLYSGLKILWYCASQGIGIYPIVEPSGRKTQLYEVYPSHTWLKVGMQRSTNLKAFVEGFNKLGIIKVTLPEEFHTVDNQDIADSIVACITIATIMKRDRLFEDFSKQPAFASNEEWRVAINEGLIVRI